MTQCHFLNLQEVNTGATNETDMISTNNIYRIPFVKTNLTRCPCPHLTSPLLFSLFFNKRCNLSHKDTSIRPKSLYNTAQKHTFLKHKTSETRSQIPERQKKKNTQILTFFFYFFVYLFIG
jgi:hypothetical protein